jgi:hypothetical protein
MEQNTVCVREPLWVALFMPFGSLFISIGMVAAAILFFRSPSTIAARIIYPPLALGMLLFTGWVMLHCWRFRILVHEEGLTIRPTLGRTMHLHPCDLLGLRSTTSWSSRRGLQARFYLKLDRKEIRINPDLLNFPHLAAYLLRLRRKRKLTMDRKTANLLEGFRTGDIFGKQYPNPPEI